MHTVYLALGSNIGDKERNIHNAIKNIQERIGDVIAVSAFYTTKPVGFDSGNNFINAACKVYTKLNPLEVLEYTQIIEKELGRVTKSKPGVYSDRIIDIDILLYDDEVLEYPHLIIPHPHMHLRHFVLLPLNDIAQDVVHPVLNRTINELVEKLDHSDPSDSAS